MIINKLGGSSIRSNNIYFAYNKQTLLVFFIAHAEHNLIKLKLYNNLSTQAVNNISENAMWNSNGSIKFPHFWKLANERCVNTCYTNNKGM